MRTRALKIALWSVPTIAMLYPIVGYESEIATIAVQNAIEGASLFFVDFDLFVTAGSAPAKT